MTTDARLSAGDVSNISPCPNLFIIGAAKCGTTTLHSFLDARGDIFMSDIKEPGFFVPEFQYHPKKLSWYLSLFKQAGNQKYIGESSTHYTKRPLYEGVAQRIYDFSPNARLIYLIRDPIERAISHYWHNTRSLRKEFQELRPMLSAMIEDPLYKEYGDYTMQLEPWIRLFGRDKLYVMVFEEMIQAPEEELGKLLKWLDLPSSSDGLHLEKLNVRTDRFTKPRGNGFIQRFRHSAFWEAVSPFVHQRAKKWASGFAKETVKVTLPDMKDEVIEYLQPWALERVADTEKLLGKPLPVWKTSQGNMKG